MGVIRRFETVARYRRARVHDPMSGTNTLSDWGSANREQVAGCLFSPGTSADFPNIDLEQLQGLATLYLPLGASVEDGDRVAARGRIWAVKGFRNDWAGDLVDGSVVTLEYIRDEV